jgi:RNA polymerase sigma-70 factor (sigma-E family)
MAGSDSTDFGEFVAARSSALFRTALLLTGDRHAADDLVQATLEKACRKWNRVSRADSPEAYVRRILVNEANDGWRKLDRSGGRHLPLMDEDRPDDRDPYRQTDQRDQLLRQLLKLPMGMRAILVLRYFDDLDDAAIAELTGTSTANVRSQASRGLAKLRAEVVSEDGKSARLRFGGATA